VGALFGVKQPPLIKFCTPTTTTPTDKGAPVTPGQPCPTGTAPSFEERFLGNTAKPRISVGAGVNWNSPFGPFRIDIAKALTKAEGDDTKLFSFNVGTAF
jgi:outer membrane protein insertion porin family